MKQAFQVTIRVDADVESGDGKPYLTESRVRKQIEKLTRHGSIITDGLPCHGSATIRVTDVIEMRHE